MFMHHSKHKKTLAIIFGGILLLGAGILLFSLKDRTAPSTGIPSPMSDPALKQAIADYYHAEIDHNGESYFDEVCRTPEESDYEARNYDLDGDGINEFIVSIDFYCGHPLRSPSGGHGDYVIFKKESDVYISQGSVFGNSYGVAPQVKVNGRSTIYTTETANTKYSFIHEWHWNPEKSGYEKATPNFSPMIQPMVYLDWHEDMYYPVYAFFKDKYSREATALLEVGSVSAVDTDDNGEIIDDVGVGRSRYFTKDITGDGEPEIFVQMEANGHGNRWYQILQWQNGSFINIREEGNENNWIDFDDIEYNNGFVFATWHGNYERGMTQYQLEGNILKRIRSIGFYADGYNATDCNIRQVNIRPDQSVSFTELEYKENCNICTDDLYEYFEVDRGPQQANIDGKIMIVSFKRDSETERSGNLIVTADGKQIWQAHIPGVAPYKFSYKFMDVGEDGEQDIWVHGLDDNGDPKTCREYFYRYNGSTFEPIKFVGTVNRVHWDWESMNCSLDGETKLGLNIFHGSDVYTGYVWEYSYPELWEQYRGVNSEVHTLLSFPDERVRYCNLSKVQYTFDGKNFVESSREMIEKDVDAYFENREACY